MMDVGNVKEAINAAEAAMMLGGIEPRDCDVFENGLGAIEYLRSFIAELEKSAKDIKGAPVDSKEAARLVFDCIKIEDDGHRKYPVPDIQWGAQVIQQYAESYHAKKCAECKALMATDDVSDREA